MAEGLAEVGAIVALNGRNVATLETAVSTLQGRGLKAEASPFDVTDQYAAQAAIDAIVSQHGRLDILIANAGINHRVPLDDWTPADWDRVLDANLKSCFFLAQHAAKSMSRQRNGRIIFTTSIASILARGEVHAMRPRRADWLALLVLLPANLASTALLATVFAPVILKQTSPRHICTVKSTSNGSIAGCL